MSKELSLREKLDGYNSAIHKDNFVNWELVKKEAVVTMSTSTHDKALSDRVEDDIWETIQLYKKHSMGRIPPRCPKNAKETTEAYLDRVYALGGYINARNAINTTPTAFDLGF